MGQSVAYSYDAIVIGSGFGGAVSACRLAERGEKVLVLERGRRWDVDDYPRGPEDDWLWDERRPENTNGWIDLRFFEDMAVARGAGVGGGSLVYTGVSVVPPKTCFEQGWPKSIRYEELLPYYERVGRMFKVQTLPKNQLTKRYKLMREAAEAEGFGDRFHSVEMAINFSPNWHYGLDDPFNDNKSVSWINEQGQSQGTCVHCANCVAGCQVKAKNTLEFNYIPQAEKHGAEVRPLHIVRRLSPLGEGGYRVDFERLDNGRTVTGYETAKRVVIAAGSLGSTELLLRCRDEYKTMPAISNRLGCGWSPNGDFVTPALYQRDVSSSQGPTISSAIDLLDGEYEGAGLFVEDGGFPDFVGNFLEERINKAWEPLKSRFRTLLDKLGYRVRQRDPMDRLMLWFGQAVDAADGRFYLKRPWYAPKRMKFMLDWDISLSAHTLEAMASLHRKLSTATGGSALTPPSWTLFENLITPHPLGGCAMGEDPQSGVVNHLGEVFGYPNLYVVDGAIFPRALGVNPSRTIAALAERIIEKMPV